MNKPIMIQKGEWHGYAVGQDFQGKTKSEVMDKMYRAEHCGLSRPRPKSKRRWTSNPTPKKGSSKKSIAMPVALGALGLLWFVNRNK